MNDFANRVEPEIPIYINNFEKGIEEISKLVHSKFEVAKSCHDGSRLSFQERLDMG